MSWHRDREDSAAEVDRTHAGKRPQPAQSAVGDEPDRLLAPAGNDALSRLLRPGRLPAAPSALAPAGNGAVGRLMRAATEQRADLPAQDAGPLNPEIAAAIDAERGGGAPLPEGIRTEMEGHLGVDLSPVRVHTGQRADTLNRAVNAQAFTTGTDVFFSAGRYDPASPSGRELIAHELTHVAQQAGGTVDTGARVSHPADAAEVEARDVAHRVTRSAAGPEPVRGAGPGRVARRPATGLVARGPGDAPVPAPAPQRQEPGLWDMLNDPAVRKTIEDETQSELLIAAKDFTAACDAHIAALKALAKAKADNLALLVDIFMGFLSPVMTNVVLTSRLGPKLDGLFQQFAKQVGDAKKEIRIVSEADIIKTSFSTATKLANDQLKKNAQPLFGEIAEEQFLDRLAKEFDKGVIHLSGQLHKMSPVQLISVWAAYDPDIANKANYKTVLQEILKQFRLVQEISHKEFPRHPGSREMGMTPSHMDFRAYYIVAGGKRALAIVSEIPNPLGPGNYRMFRGWVTEPGLADSAVQQTKKTFGEVKQIPAGEVHNITAIP
jgi:uncharacterized protein DUF4157